MAALKHSGALFYGAENTRNTTNSLASIARMDVQGTSTMASQQRSRPSLLSIDTPRAGWSFETDDEPLSPTARMFQDLHILMVLGLAAPVDICELRVGLEATLVQHPRFNSIRVLEPDPRWVRTVVNLDNHIIVPDLDPTAASVNSDKLVEDYLASLSTLPMDDSRPLWEVHVLNFPTSEAAASLVFRIHHAIGDGMSLISLLVACDQKPKILPSPAPAPRKRPICAVPPREATSAGALAFIAWVLSYALLAWHSLVDLARLLAMPLLPGDPRTVFTGVKGVEFRRKRFVSHSLSLDDVKHVKNALNCTINDVLLGVLSAALTRYYFRKQGDHFAKKSCLRLRLIVPVDMRPTPGIQKLENLMDPHTNNDARWGNRVGYMILPFYITSHEDPLEYVRQAKKSADRKKYSLETIFTKTISEMVTIFLGLRYVYPVHFSPSSSPQIAGPLIRRIVSRTTAASSNMTGPIEQLELFGNKVLYIAPTVYGPPSALTVHWQSYMDTIRVILAVDDREFSDCHQLLDDFAEALKIMRDSS
ncbi:hypothetical protein EJB05_44288, partial [Eragrostis curvula]